MNPKAIPPKELKSTIKALNETGMVDPKIEMIGQGRTTAVLAQEFVDAVNKIADDGKEEGLPDNVVDAYNKIINEEPPPPEEEKPKEKKERKPSEVKTYIAELISSGDFTRKEVQAKTQEKFPNSKMGTISTYISDGKSTKYNKFAEGLVVEDPETKKLSFQAQS